MGELLRRVTPLYDAFRRIADEWVGAGLALATSPEEMALITDGIESVVARGVPGDVLECGCFTGFSSACLSLACREAGRALYVADSFQGLPETDDPQYTAGQFACTRETWEVNVRRFGAWESVVPVPGWYADTLANWNKPLAVVWLDVDLGLSVRDALAPVLPSIPAGGLLYGHEAAAEYFDDYKITDRANGVWRQARKVLGDRPHQAAYQFGYLAEVQL